jgi:hypothetical protein
MVGGDMKLNPGGLIGAVILGALWFGLGVASGDPKAAGGMGRFIWLPLLVGGVIGNFAWPILRRSGDRSGVVHRCRACGKLNRVMTSQRVRCGACKADLNPSAETLVHQ